MGSNITSLLLVMTILMLRKSGKLDAIGKVCTISFERPIKYLCDAWHVFPPKYEVCTHLIGLELNTNARESFEHC